MTDVDENVNPMLGTNQKIAESLAKRIGRKMAEQLLDLLRDPDLKKVLDELRSEFGIEPNSNLNSEEVDQYIVDAMHQKINVGSAVGSVQDMGEFMHYTSLFEKALREIMELFDVDVKQYQLLKTYVAKEHVEAIDAVYDLVRVDMDSSSKDLTIHISAQSYSSEDLRSVVKDIYTSWDILRPKPKKLQPSPKKERNVELVRYSKDHSLHDTADKFEDDENTWEANRRAISRSKK